MKATLSTLCLAFVLPLAASAACPGPDDLAVGYILEDNRKTLQPVHLHWLDDDNVMVNAWRSPLLDYTWIIHRVGGLLETQARKSNGSYLKVTTQADDPAPLLDMVPGSTHVMHSDGTNSGQTWHYQDTYSVHNPVTVEIGNCSYDGIRLEIAMEVTRPDGKISNSARWVSYVPDLKLRLVVVNGVAEFSDIRVATADDLQTFGK